VQRREKKGKQHEKHTGHAIDALNFKEVRRVMYFTYQPRLRSEHGVHGRAIQQPAMKVGQFSGSSQRLPTAGKENAKNGPKNSMKYTIDISY
jgi:hypothetical protein